MNGMTLKKFLQTMIDYDEIEFSYLDVLYNFQKENADNGKIKISVWQSGESPKCCYSVEVEDTSAEFAKVSKNLIEEKILFDGKSISEAEKNISVEFFT